MSVDSPVSIARDVLRYLVSPIKRPFGYVISSTSYARDLEKEFERLSSYAEKIRDAVAEARNGGRVVYSLVTQWLAKVEEASKEVQDTLGDFGETQTCSYGPLPDPNRRYRFSRKAKHQIEGIRRLVEEGRQFKDVIDPAPGNISAPTPARREGKDVVLSTSAMFSTSASLGLFESRASVIRDIVDALADDSKSVVGVYGVGGVGKSTLLEDVERRIREDKLFDLVAKADVSAFPDIKRIQGEIACALGLDLKDGEHESARADHLCGRLENGKKKVLIILDDLWKGLDLKSVGIPGRHDNRVIGCKLLLASRDRDVLLREMCCDMDFHLGGLKEEEAKELFETMVGDKAYDDEFKPLADEALHLCAGVPFLILKLAKLFKVSDLSEWKDTLKQMERSKDKGINEVINKKLQLSSDDLKEEAMAKHVKDAGLSERKNALKQIKMSKSSILSELIDKMLQFSYDQLKYAEKSFLALCVA